MKPGPEFVSLRKQLVRNLSWEGISDARVLKAIEEVPREFFVLPELVSKAYDDHALPIGQGQTISQPYTVALMCEAAQLRETDRVLEIGTGSGYGAAVLSRLCRHVYSIERLPELQVQAGKRLSELGYRNITLATGDGTLGLPEFAPYDAILVTAGARHLPPAYSTQLAEGGRIVIPIGEGMHMQNMFRYTKQGNHLRSENLGIFAFVPLVGEEGWDEEAGY